VLTTTNILLDVYPRGLLRSRSTRADEGLARVVAVSNADILCRVDTLPICSSGFWLYLASLERQSNIRPRRNGCKED
jgi:hypothetical protein